RGKPSAFTSPFLTISATIEAAIPRHQEPRLVKVVIVVALTRTEAEGSTERKRGHHPCHVCLLRGSPWSPSRLALPASSAAVVEFVVVLRLRRCYGRR
ncbi:hypothetical protein S245_001170, partial [Arachis hypogaea]